MGEPQTSSSQEQSTGTFDLGDIQITRDGPHRTLTITIPGKPATDTTPAIPKTIQKLTIQSGNPNITIDDLIQKGLIQFDPHTGLAYVPGHTDISTTKVASGMPQKSTDLKAIMPADHAVYSDKTKDTASGASVNEAMYGSGNEADDDDDEKDEPDQALQLTGMSASRGMKEGKIRIKKECIPVNDEGRTGEMQRTFVKGKSGGMTEDGHETEKGELVIEEGKFRDADPEGGGPRDIKMKKKKMRRSIRIVSPQQPDAVEVLKECGMDGEAQHITETYQDGTNTISYPEESGKTKETEIVATTPTGQNVKYKVKSVLMKTEVRTVEQNRRRKVVW